MRTCAGLLTTRSAAAKKTMAVEMATAMWMMWGASRQPTSWKYLCLAPGLPHSQLAVYANVSSMGTTQMTNTTCRGGRSSVRII